MGRNLKNTPVIRKLLPYELVISIIRDKKLHEQHLEISTRFVSIGELCAAFCLASVPICEVRHVWAYSAAVHDLYADSEPYEHMARLRTVRTWANIPKAAESKALSARLTTSLNTRLPNWWTGFDDLKDFLLHYVQGFFNQTATDTAAHPHTKYNGEHIRTQNATKLRAHQSPMCTWSYSPTVLQSYSPTVSHVHMLAHTPYPLQGAQRW